MKNKDYFDWVYHVVKQVPRGRVTTYGAIADYLALGSARMVGWALRNLSDPKIPAHRVVNSSGHLTGRHHFKPPSLMQERLEREGIEVINSRVLQLKDKMWIPSKELPLDDVDL